MFLEDEGYTAKLCFVCDYSTDYVPKTVPVTFILNPLSEESEEAAEQQSQEEANQGSEEV